MRGRVGRPAPMHPETAATTPIVSPESLETVPDVGRLLRDLRRRQARDRRDAELTYRELAAKAGWSHAAVGQYLSGRTLPPTDRFDTLIRLLGATAAEQGRLATARDRIEERRRRSRQIDGGRQAGPDRAADPMPVVPPLPRGRAPRQLPAKVPGFVGRAAQLAELTDLLGVDGRAPESVISALSGSAGVGKTSLAVHWAHSVADRFPDGQLYVNLRGFDPGGRVMAPAEAVRGFLDALGVPAERIPSGFDAQTALFRSLTAGKRFLVVLDNARDAEQVRPLLPGTATAMTVITSRNQLTGLLAVDGAHLIDVDLLSTGEARDLVARRLGRRSTAECAAVDQIIVACDRLPLALSIAAARARGSRFPLGVLAAELSEAGRRLDALDAGDPASQVRAVFSWSSAVLSAPAARLFRLLGLPPGPDISTAAAASLAGLAVPMTRQLLGELTRNSLLIEHGPGRYTFHDLLKAYATDLADTVEPAAARHSAMTRLLDHYTHSARTAARLLYPLANPIAVPLTPPAPGAGPERLTRYADAMTWLGTERAVLLAILGQNSAAFDTYTCQLTWSLDTFLYRRGHWHDHEKAWQITLRAARRLGNRRAEAHAHRGLANTATLFGRFDDAHTHLGQAIALSAAAGDRVGQAHGHHRWATLWEHSGRPDLALVQAEQSLVHFDAIGHRAGLAHAVNTVGWYHTLLGDHRQALVCCQRAMRLHEELGDRHGVASTWDSLGHAHDHLGQHDRAVDCYRRSLALTRELGDRYYEATTLSHLGDAYHTVGNQADARTAWTDAWFILTELHHPDATVVHAKLAVGQPDHDAQPRQHSQRVPAARPVA